MDIVQLLLLLVMAFMLSTVATSLAIPILQRKHAGQNIRAEGPESHMSKSGTPSMGGVAIIAATLVTVIATKQLTVTTGVLVFGFVVFGTIGFADDYLKIIRRNNLGLRAWQKFGLQTIGALALVLAMSLVLDRGTLVLLPFTGGTFDLGKWYIPFAVFVVLAMVNSVNLTDGLDGLASGVTGVVAVFFALAGVTLGNEAGTSFAICLAGACIGFLIFNRYPAKIFMGDTGSLALGGGLAAVAILLNMDLFLPIAGFIFVIEALSVIIQVVSFKTRGKRVFKMSPIHHHFELSGMKETKVVGMFWVATIIFCGIGIGVM